MKALVGGLILAMTTPAWGHQVEAALKARAERAFQANSALASVRSAMQDKHWKSLGVQVVDLGRLGPEREPKARLLYVEIWERKVASFIQNRTLAAEVDLVIPGEPARDSSSVRLVGLKALSPLEVDQLPSGDDPSDG